MEFKGVRRSDIVIDLAQAYLEEARYDESIRLLMSTPYFVNWEGSSITWDIFNQSHIRKGIDFVCWSDQLLSFIFFKDTS